MLWLTCHGLWLVDFRLCDGFMLNYDGHLRLKYDGHKHDLWDGPSS